MSVSTSVGLAVLDGTDADAASLRARADDALYAAKRAGRDAYVKSTARLTEAARPLQRTAANGEQGLDLARADVADVVVLDIGLPDIDGYEVARRLAKPVEPDVLAALLQRAEGRPGGPPQAGAA